MITENLPTLKIHKLTQAQYDRELTEGNIDENALYLTPDEGVDLSNYATKAYADQAEADALSAAKTYANSLSSNYATAAQGAKADTALQSSDIAAAAKKGVDTSISAESNSTNLPTSAAVADFVESKGYTQNVGTVTSVAAGNGLTGNTITGSGTISHADTSSQESVTAGNRKYITGVNLDEFGHVTGLTTGTETVVDTDTGATSVEVTGTGNAITSATYDAASRKITLTKGATYNNYSLPNAGTNLGGVKTGGVATISNGQITAVSKATSADSAAKVANKLTIGSKTYDGSGAVSVSASDLGLSNALHFIGEVSTLPATGTNGDVVLLGTKEYVYSDGWVELGDGDSHALKTITITAGGGLTGGGNLSANRTISHADTSSQASVTASDRTYVTGVTLDSYGHVTGLTTGTETVTDTTYDNATESVAGLMSAADKKLVNALSKTNLGNFGSKTVADLRTALDNWITNYGIYPNASAVFGSEFSWVGYWNDENTTTTLNAGYTWTVRIVSYQTNPSYTMMEISTYQDKRLYYVAKNGGTWGKVRKVTFNTDIPTTYAGSDTAGGAATSANKLNPTTRRPASANVTIVGDGSISTFKATNSMTTGKPMGDGNIIHFEWDNTSGYSAQLYVPVDSNSYSMQYRGMMGNWLDWKTIVDSENIGEHLPVVPVEKGGTGATTLPNIIKMLCNSTANTSPSYVIGLGSSYQNSGYTSMQNLRNAMGLGNTTSALPVANGGTGSSNGATGLKNLFAAGYTVLSSKQYAATLPSASSMTDGTVFFKVVG